MKKMIPGVLVALLIALLAKGIESLLPIHLIGASVLAMFIGMGLRQVWYPKALGAGLKFTSKRILKFAIILLGASLSIPIILNVGKLSLMVMVFTLLTCFGGGYLVGKALGLDWKISNLISAGTGICGGSAIAAIAPVIEAEDKDIAYAMAATFLFDMAMIVLFPILGHSLGLTDMAYGLWAGTAVNDTSSVVAAGFAFSESAGNFATMVKLTRTLTIIPTVLVFAMVQKRMKRRELGAEVSVKKVSIGNLFPWFILGFLAMAGVNSLGFIPEAVSLALKESSKFLMVAALAAIGMNTGFDKLRAAGWKPMWHGFIISLLVVLVAIAVEWCMGLV